MLALPAGDRPRLYDFFVQTPGQRPPAGELDFRRIEVDFGTTTQAFHIGRGSAAVPGMVRGLFEVHEALGRMPMTEVVHPAVALASRGLEVSAYQAYLLGVVRSIFAATEESLAIFGSRERPGELIGEGERLFQPELADTWTRSRGKARRSSITARSHRPWYGTWPREDSSEHGTSPDTGCCRASRSRSPAAAARCS